MGDLRRIDKCRACERPIIWAQTSTGRAMPVDAEPTMDGNIQLFPTVARKWLAVVVGMGTSGGPRERYKSHFATCPEASKFRKPKKAEPR